MNLTAILRSLIPIVHPVGNADGHVETFADWQEANKTWRDLYLDDARRVRGAMICNVWAKVDVARTLIRKAQPMRVEDLRNAIR